MTRLDVVCIGDTATDVFIRLRDERVAVRKEGGHSVLVLPYGEKVPFEHAQTVAAGGNAANAAVAMALLGCSVALATHVGDDAGGREILAALAADGVDTRFVSVDTGAITNRNFVLWHGADRTILVHHESYDYHWPKLRGDDVPRWTYLSSVGSAAGGAYYDSLADWLLRHPEVHFAFQPGTLQIADGIRRLGPLYRRADLLICNREEAAELCGTESSEIGSLLSGLRSLGPSTVVITDGPAGAWADERGLRRLAVPALPDATPPVDRTGAGDAFAATVVAGLVHGLDLRHALEWAPVNAQSVVHAVGSQEGLLNRKGIEAALAERPPGWGVREL